MADVTVKACDRCKQQPATEWHAGQAGSKLLAIDLCESCAREFREFIKQARVAKPKRPTRGTIVKTRLPDDQP